MDLFLANIQRTRKLGMPNNYRETMGRVLSELVVRVRIRTPFTSPFTTPAGSRRNSMDLEEYLDMTSELMHALESTGFSSDWAPRQKSTAVVPEPRD